MSDNSSSSSSSLAPLENNQCRMYENQFPNAEDLLMVQVKNVAEMGAYVSLLEYGGIEGMILLSEVSRRRIRSISKLIRVGRTETVVCLRVDKEKGYIDLSKRRVSPEDIVAAEAKYNKSKAVHSIIRHVSETTRTRMEDLYKMFAWDLYKRFGHAYDAFQICVQQHEKILSQYNLPEPILKCLLSNIQRKMTPVAVKIRADIEVMCFSYEGIDAIRAGLAAGEALSTADIPVKIKLVAPPLYVVMTTTTFRDEGVKLLDHACAVIEKVVKSKGGEVTVKTAARIVNEKDDRALINIFDTLKAQNAQVAGDDATDD